MVEAVLLLISGLEYERAVIYDDIDHFRGNSNAAIQLEQIGKELDRLWELRRQEMSGARPMTAPVSGKSRARIQDWKKRKKTVNA